MSDNVKLVELVGWLLTAVDDGTIGTNDNRSKEGVEKIKGLQREVELAIQESRQVSFLHLIERKKHCSIVSSFDQLRSVLASIMVSHAKFGKFNFPDSLTIGLRGLKLALSQ